MEARIAQLEADVAAIRSNYATKEDLHALSESLIKSMVGTAIGLGATAITVITFVLNYAIPRPLPVAQVQPQAPVVINLPPPAARQPDQQ